ncbi:peptidoglycan D,D-transpeptidase FtsI family protein [Trueperella bialowiezensis]|uniref:Penicillin-binding protein A n=1 Tax=Trueperella bialowiezensis TaxID=312285 RepID=A0A3S4UZ46_9ACTO|nr:penicillin-binding protein 2 [Trueperella bialowiezensis]VEI13364.1 Penicillin-binding protein A [Trueperella bialowiezensis]
MNPPLRKLTAVVMIMFVTVMIAATSISFFRADSLNADARNARTLYKQYGVDRGPIIVAGEKITDSVETASPYNYQRSYLQPELYAHLTGYFSVSHNAMTGLERAENPILGGSATELAPQRLGEMLTGADPEGGAVALTIDPAAQQAAWDALGERRGAVVAIEPQTGKILAMVSKPSFDPNLIASHDSDTANDAWESYNSAESKPLLNRAIGDDLYAPGSVFKIITTAAMIENGANADEPVEAPHSYSPPGTTHEIFNPGRLHCGDGSGSVPLRTAFVESCNTAFAIGGLELGAEKMTEMAEAFGFHQELEIPLTVRPSRFPEPQDQAELAGASFGQYNVVTSPLQMAMVAAAIANDGKLMTPYLVHQRLTADLGVISTTSPSTFSTPISKDTAEQLESMMIDVVNKGTGAYAASSHVQVAGKTGSAEIAAGVEPHAWFAGYDASDKPRVAVGVFVENGGDGGQQAGPIARAVIEAVVAK